MPLFAEGTDNTQTISVQTEKLFKQWINSFKKDAISTLEAITAILTAYPKANFVVEGHTDSVSSEGFNQKLSEARAAQVVTFLTTGGIASERLESVGFGETNPIESNRTASGRAANRRVEVKLAK